MKKYNRAGAPQTTQTIAKCGRQILEALNYLKAVGYPYPHLQTSNVLLYNGVCCLSDLESVQLGFPSSLQIMGQAEFHIDFFGQLLYELATGKELDTTAFGLDNKLILPSTITDPLRSILESIFSATPPTIETLLNNAFFSSVSIPPIDVKAKVSGNLQTYFSSLRDKVGSTIRTRPVIKEEPEPAEELPSSPKTKPKKPKRRTVKSMTLENGEKSSDGLYSTTELNLSPKAPLFNSQVPSVPNRTPIPPPRNDDNTSANITAPPSAPAAPKAPPKGPPPPKAPAAKGERKALLSSIEGFNSRGLKKAVTNDRSAPKFGK